MDKVGRYVLVSAYPETGTLHDEDFYNFMVARGYTIRGFLSDVIHTKSGRVIGKIFPGSRIVGERYILSSSEEFDAVLEAYVAQRSASAGGFSFPEPEHNSHSL